MENCMMQRMNLSDGVHKESAAEYILPDYEEDIKRILMTEARVVPNGVYHDSEEAVASGTVEYRVLYVGGGGQISGIEFTSDYALTHKIPECATGEISKVKLTGHQVRLVGPRKISARAQLLGEYQCFTEENVEPLGNAFAGGFDVHTLEKKLETRYVLSGTAEEREYAEMLCTLETNETVAVCYADAEVTISECRTEKNGTVVSGFLDVTALLRVCEDVTPYEVRIPFEELVVIEGCEDGMTAFATGTVRSVHISVNDAENGKEAVASVILALSATLEHNRELSVISDAFATDGELACEYRDLVVDTGYGTVKKSFTHRCELPLSELENPEVREVLFTRAELKPIEVCTGLGELSLSCELTYHFVGVCVNHEGEGKTYIKGKHREPLSYSISVPGAEPGMHIELLTSVKCTPVTVDFEKMYLESEICVTALLSASRTYSVIGEAVYTESEPKKPASEFTVFYPQTNESLWCVAKENHVSPARLAEDNGIAYEASTVDSPASLDGIERLIII